MWKRTLRLPTVRIGVGILLFFVLMSTIGPVFVTSVLGLSPTELYIESAGQPPSVQHWLGVTSSGQDVLARIVYGARGSLLVGLASGVIATVMSVVIGTWAGFLGGISDRILNTIINLFLTMPSFAVTLIIAGYVKKLDWLAISFIIGFFEWPGGARRIRAQAMSLRGRDFTAALRVTGERPWRIILSEVSPHLNGVASSMFLTAFVYGVFAQASMAFLGIGDPETISWGTEIYYAEGQNALFRGMWWWFLPPGLSIALLGTATTLINFGIDEVVNPALNSRQQTMVRKFNKMMTRKAKQEAAA
ncbi:MAG: ABC transporter permease [Propionibacteriaceae bacterium]|nr:ABC transporter permease [Propionibacteriaceae bacterium]